MRIIITGGTGLIGRALATSLIADKHEVIVLSRSPHRVEGMETSVRVVGWDARTAEGWGDLVDGADVIINLAGASIAGDGFFPTRWTPERRRLIRDSRLNEVHNFRYYSHHGKEQGFVQSHSARYHGQANSK